ncbi:MAG: type VI secretion system tip protein VgrG [Betaproteobacteria bacterium HGW-Betaproteobacteria-13]|jgi:type VI secretion system secreted protein VgrG|nr:MAG: type VI secretion system tip protein VgrG [Betaproteobacteria bacterium HGW-Betaproteobacteria-13]
MTSSLSGVLAALFPYSDHARLLSLQLDDGDPAGDQLVVQRLRGREALSECPAFDLDCLALNANIEAKALLGRRASVRLSEGVGFGAARWFNGIVTSVAPGEADGGRRRYRLTLRPAFALLDVARSAWIHLERSVPDIIDAELSRWQAGMADLQWRFDLLNTYPVRSYTALYAESPLAFIERLCAEEGIGYRFEHPSPEDAPVGTTILVFFDDSSSLPMNPRALTRFHAADTMGEEGAIDRWTSARAIVPGATAMTSWEYKDTRVLAATVPTTHQHGAASALASTLEDFAPQSQYYGAGAADLERYARLRIEAFEAQAKVFDGAGSVRSFAPGTATELDGHFDDADAGSKDARCYLLLSVDHDACNNLPSDFAGEPAVRGLEPGYRNGFTAMRQSVVWRPAFDSTHHAKPVARGLQTAQVVGAEGREIDVDEYGRVLVQFHWDREQRNTCRLRVANALSGSGWGMQTLPRVGQEVLVDFIEGDIDRPMVIGAVHNGRHMPPRFSGEGSLPANHALSGIQTREFGGGRGYGELLFDDTGGQLRTKLSSEHASTQLNQGWLCTPRAEGQAEPRGEGFELRSDAAGSVRGAKGLLLTAFGRLRASGAQLSREETASLMDECLQLFRQLGDYAQRHEAGATEPGPHAKLNDDFKQWENGSNTATGGAGGGSPLIAVTAPAGVHVSSPRSVVTHAGSTVDTVALQHLQFASGERTTLNAGQGMSLFAQSGGIKLIAHQGKLDLQSQHDDTRISAAKDLKLAASGGQLHGMAADEILFSVAGGAYIRLAGGNVEIGAPGTVRVRAASHDWSGPASMSSDLPRFGAEDLGRTPVLVRPTDGAPVEGQHFEIERPDGSILKGTTDSQGRTATVNGSSFERLVTRFFPSDPS